MLVFLFSPSVLKAHLNFSWPWHVACWSRCSTWPQWWPSSWASADPVAWPRREMASDGVSCSVSGSAYGRGSGSGCGSDSGCGSGSPGYWWHWAKPRWRPRCWTVCSPPWGRQAVVWWAVLGWTCAHPPANWPPYWVL